jgi:hypothetical protein
MDWILKSAGIGSGSNTSGSSDDKDINLDQVKPTPDPPTVSIPHSKQLHVLTDACCALKNVQFGTATDSPSTPTALSSSAMSFGGDESGERLALLWHAYHSSKQNSSPTTATNPEHLNASHDFLLSYMEAFNLRFGGL